jgi:hypothetical protein
VAATRMAKKNSTTPTAAVAPGEGTNSGRPSELGTALLRPEAGENAIRKCHSAKTTKATLTDKAMAVFTRLTFDVAHGRRGRNCNQFDQ